MLSETWAKSGRSNNNGACVEARLNADMIEIRDSKDQGGPVLSFTKAEWLAFTGGVEDGDFKIG
jgi:hypothetical protein